MMTNYDVLRVLACFLVEIGDNAWQELVLHSKMINLVGPRSSLCKKKRGNFLPQDAFFVFTSIFY